MQWIHDPVAMTVSEMVGSCVVHTTCRCVGPGHALTTCKTKKKTPTPTPTPTPSPGSAG